MTRRSDLFAVFVFVVVIGAGGFITARSYFLPKISADIQNTGTTREILENNDFSLESFNSIIWQKFSNNAGNNPAVENNQLNFGIEKSIKGGYQIIAQPVTLHIGKSYTISIEHKDNKALTSTEGFTTGTILGKPIFEKEFSKAVFTPNVEINNAFFFLKVKADQPGLLGITKVSVIESVQIATSALISPSSTITASPSPVPTRTASPKPVATATVAKTASPTPTVTQTPIAKLITATPTATPNATPLVFPSRWSFIGFGSPINTSFLTKAGLKVYSMHNGKWKVAENQTRDSNFLTLVQDGLYIFNPQETEVKIDQPNLAQTGGSLYPSTGWNLLYNSKDAPVPAGSLTVDLGKKGTATITSLTAQKSVSTTFYTLKQTASGVALENGDFTKDTIPPKTAYWLYLF